MNCRRCTYLGAYLPAYNQGRFVYQPACPLYECAEPRLIKTFSGQSEIHFPELRHRIVLAFRIQKGEAGGASEKDIARPLEYQDMRGDCHAPGTEVNRVECNPYPVGILVVYYKPSEYGTQMLTLSIYE